MLGCCWAETGAGTATMRAIASAPAINRICAKSFAMRFLSLLSSVLFRRRGRCRTVIVASRRNRFAVSGLPAPGTGTIAAPRYTFLVDLRDDVTVARKQ